LHEQDAETKRLHEERTSQNGMYDALKLHLDNITAELDTARLSINEQGVVIKTLNQKFEQCADELRIRTMERDQARCGLLKCTEDLQRNAAELILARQERDDVVGALERVTDDGLSYFPTVTFWLLRSYNPGSIKQMTLSRDINRTYSVGGCCRTTAVQDSTQ
jgi:hypothetical protein